MGRISGTSKFKMGVIKFLVLTLELSKYEIKVFVNKRPKKEVNAHCKLL